LDMQKMYTVTANEFAFGFFQYILAQASMPAPVNVAMPDSSLTEFLAVLGYITALPAITPVMEGRVQCPMLVPTDHPVTLPAHMDAGNFPNPVSTGTSIFFTVPANGFTLLRVYDMAGKEIATLVKGDMTTGTHMAHFNASSLAPGMYAYRLEQNGTVVTRKMMVVK
jgi:hypothetical protein